MNFSSIFSLFDKKNKVVIDEVTSVSSLAPKILTKKEDLEKVQPYLDKLKDTLNAKGINNIALTGGYGSGKSSLLKTFQHWNKNEYNFLNISLAAFNKTEENTVKNEELERQLEISILQQIIYKVNPVNLPESRFKRIVNIPNWKLWGLIPISFTIWLMSVILLFKYNYLDKLNPNTWTFRFKDLDFSTNLIFLFSFLGIGYFSKLVVELFSNSKINKVNLKGEIEIGDNSNKSILNEHYDEILYYFEKNNFNVVVIEDLDRFDNTNIFTKLRELNILLNNADSINNRNCYKDFGIKFLYAVGDDLFNDKKERVKFFEYIIPVIPFINSSNANEQLRTLIKESDLEENVFPKEFLSDITTFIDDIDMRLLINIFHEFVIYRNVLKPDVLKGNESELFAMITYKNIDPEDFNKLNNKEGKLYKLINDKKKYTQALLTQINTKIVDRENEIENINNENISDIEELKSIYLKTIIKKLPSTYLISNENINDDIFNKLGDKKVVKCKEYDNYYRQLYDREYPIVFSEIENEVNPDFNYNERVELIKSKDKNKKNLLQKEIEKLRSEKSEIENWDLKQIFKEVDINQYLNDFTNNGLLRNLILEGYINENYNDYISLFHEVSLTKEDKKFERNVKSGFYEGFEYKLTHIENLVDNHIDLKYFKRDTILNFDLLNYLGNNYNKYSEKYDAIISVLSNEKEKSVEFIDKYISIDERPLKIFIEKLVKHWKGFWDYIYIKSNFTPEKEDKYLSLIIQFGLIDDILSSQNNNTLSTAITQKSHFLSLVKSTEELNYYSKITKLIEKLNIKFEELENPNNETKELFNFVFNNSYYQINKGNILQMITLYGSINDENNFETSNYGTILQSNCKPLIDYINSNINTYLEDVYLKLEQNISESEESLLELLNNADLEDKLKIKIIQKVETHISDLSNIEDIEIKKQLLTNLKVVANWKNVIDYYSNCENKIDENLVEYLNTEIVSNKLSEIKISKEDKELEKSVLLCNDINDDIYINLLKSTYYIYNSLNFEDLNEIKVENLVKKNLSTTKTNYDKLREGFADNHITLIERDFNKFFEKIEDFETDEDDILMILKSDKITIDNRFKYIPKLTEQTIIDNKAIAKKVGEIILSKSTKVEFEFNIIESIVNSLDSIENKIKFINLYFTELSNDNIISLVKSLSNNHSELFVKRKRPLLNDNSYNRELLTKMKTKRLINSFDNDEKDNSKIRAVANY
ncbi:MAG: hypothetical protein O9282_05260 [Flavobacterium sp.]|uniref:YobI family P-loop NTPase n=1 Tax=Flavobacterium sp. TaxID=239 RepID=UPI0022BA86FF|nr:hypothetical protein [Flavobacterium sp.]MCZ8330702.1 hypothetical protein [Flavobacterium sp.]